MNARSGIVLSSLALALVFAGPAAAQQPRTTIPGPQAEKQQQQLSQKDMKFVKDAAVIGMAEVELGNLAEQNAQSNEVKEFGERMVRDHGAANNELMVIVAAKGATMPQRLDEKHKQTVDKLVKLRGAEFDRTYMREMVNGHEKAIKEFRQQAQNGTDSEIKAFAEKTLPTLEEHHRMAQDISKSLSAVGTSRAPR